jgi:hypothetical protein
MGWSMQRGRSVLPVGCEVNSSLSGFTAILATLNHELCEQSRSDAKGQTHFLMLTVAREPVPGTRHTGGRQRKRWQRLLRETGLRHRNISALDRYRSLRSCVTFHNTLVSREAGGPLLAECPSGWSWDDTGLHAS